MRLVFSECNANYTNYTFPYAIYCIKESQSELPAIYNKGFLPYTGDFTICEDIFYLARSLRVDLSRFSDSSENRRLNRKVEPLRITQKIIPKAVLKDNSRIEEFCTNYAAERFLGGSMTTERFQYIWSREYFTHLMCFERQGQALGYIFVACTEKLLHYWFCFFDTNYLQDYSLGKWLMWSAIRWAKYENLDYVYLGTCYGKKALYKVRDHKGIEFFDGNGWNDNLSLLKQLCKKEESSSADLFKDRGWRKQLFGM